MEPVRIKVKVMVKIKKGPKKVAPKLSAKTQNGHYKMRRNIGNFLFITKSQTLILRSHGLNGKMTQFTRKWENLLISCLDSANQRIKI